MPKVTYFKPNRRNPRYFKMCDAARIAREVVRDNPGDTPEEVLACIARGLGFTHISLSRTRVVEASLLPALLRSLPILIESLLTILRVLTKKYGFLLPLLKNLIELIQEIKDSIDKFFNEPEPPQAKIEDVLSPEKCKCKRGVSSTPKLIAGLRNEG